MQSKSDQNCQCGYGETKVFELESKSSKPLLFPYRFKIQSLMRYSCIRDTNASITDANVTGAKSHQQQNLTAICHISINVFFRWTLVIYKSFNRKHGYSLTNRKIPCGKPQMIWHTHRNYTQFFFISVVLR